MSVEDTLPDEIEDYVEFYLKYRDLTPNSERKTRRAVRYLREYLEEHHPDTNVNEVSSLHIAEWVSNDLREKMTDDSVNTYLSFLNPFYDFYARKGRMGNPIPDAKEHHLNLNLSNSGKERPEVSLSLMQSILDSVDQPLAKAELMMLLKTGARASEICNLDLRDINLDHEGYRRTYLEDDNHNVTLRAQIQSRPDSIYFASDITEGNVVNGEERKDSNKRVNSSIVPIDNDLKRVLLRWLACRQDTPEHPAQPLFLKRHSIKPERMTRNALKDQVARLTENAGQRLTPHFFRSYFTTMHREVPESVADTASKEDMHLPSIPKPQLHYIRGDAEEDIVDRYTQNWSLLLEATYRQNVYKFDV